MSQGLPPDFSNVEGTVTVEITAYQAGDRSADVYHGTQLVGSQPGYTLRQLRESFGGNEAYIVDPIKQQRHLVSLADLTGDPDSTRITIKYRFKPKK